MSGYIFMNVTSLWQLVAVLKHSLLGTVKIQMFDEIVGQN